jgi:hypothetical protein
VAAAAWHRHQGIWAAKGKKKKEQKKLCVGEPGDFSSFLLMFAHFFSFLLILRLILSHFGSF